MRVRSPSPLRGGRADPAYFAAFKSLVRRLGASVKSGTAEVLPIYVAGGAAMHFYTGARISDDVDAAFGGRLLLPSDLQVLYRDSQGKPRTLYFDPNYSETFALMHEDSHQDALPLALPGVAGVRVFLLQPVDLALSKLARFADIDRADILQLAKDGLITAKALRQRGEQALPGYVGNPTPVRISLKMVCRDINALLRAEGAGNSRKRGKP